MIQELPHGDYVFIFGDAIKIILKKNSSLKSGIVKNFISINFSCSEYLNCVFLCLNDFLNLKEFRMFRKEGE